MAKYNHIPIVVSIIAVFGGTLLVLNEKIGWMLSIIAAFMFATLLFSSSRVNSIASNLVFYPNFKSYGILSILFFLSLILLLLKPFRLKYQPQAKHWIMIAIVLAVLLIDKMIL